MRIRTKLYLGLGMILVLIVAVSLFLIQMFNELNHDTIQIVNHRYEKVRLLSAYRYELNNLSRELRGLPVHSNPATLADNIKLAQSYRTNTLVALDALERFVSNQEARQEIVKIRAIALNYDRIGEDIIAAVQAGVSLGEVSPLLFQGAQIRSDIAQELDNMQNAEELAIKSELNHSLDVYNMAVRTIYGCIIIGIIAALALSYWIVEQITGNLNQVTSVLSHAVTGKLDYLPRLHVTTEDEVGEIAAAFNKMADVIDNHAEFEQEQNWLHVNIAEIATMCQSTVGFRSLAQAFLEKVAPLVGATFGVFYLREQSNGEQYLFKLHSYAGEVTTERYVKFGEGLAGQCALSRKALLIDQIPDDYMQISSGLGSALPRSIFILPIEFKDEIWGVVELATFSTFGRLEQKLLTEAVKSAGITLSIIESRVKVETLLAESQTLAEELQEQSEELQTQQEELNAQQQELIAINEQLEQQYVQSEFKSRELEKAKTALEEHAKKLTQSSRYKSEFLANMSHELRTPLNSLLILAQILSENKAGNLTAKQVEYANTIATSGNDLLNLINDILDLSKIESGRMEFNLSAVRPRDLCEHITNQFKLLASRKGIEFTTDISPDVPAILYTDEQRLRQVLKNLLSNAFKFTETGSVKLEINKAKPEVLIAAREDLKVDSVIEISVHDTGIGIANDKQELIFKAFRQADGTTSRKYGGTGLGLTISRDIAKLMGGYIEVKSVVGQGSTFILYVPSYVKANDYQAIQQSAATLSAETMPAEVSVENQEVLAGKKVLIIDDDMRNLFALTSALESQHMEAIVAENGKEGIELIQEHPDVDLVLMDVMMPEMDGYKAMRLIRDIPKFKDLPIIALTAKAMKNDREQCLQAGASDYISKPVNLEQLLSLMRVWLYR